MKAGEAAEVVEAAEAEEAAVAAGALELEPRAGGRAKCAASPHTLQPPSLRTFHALIATS